MRKVFFRKSSVFLSIAVLVASGFLMFAGTAFATDQLPYITSGGQNLYISPVDNSTNALWGCDGTTIGTGAQSSTDGFNNTATIMASCHTEDIAADVCTDLNTGAGFNGYTDWYLPAIDQLSAMYSNSVNPGSGFTPLLSTWYWSSTESPNVPANFALAGGFSDGTFDAVGGKGVGWPMYVRCVRSSANPVYTVTYNNNGSNGGTVPTDPWTYETGFTVTALGNTGSLVKTGYTFAGWNTANDGSGTTYASASTFAMGSANVTLYAQWAPATYSDTEDEPDRAKDISWKAEKYTDSNKSCSERLKLTIKGKNFDKDAEVFIGGKEASAVNVKNSKELTAKFCLEKLLNDKVDQKRKITVKNPDTDKTEANKQINLGDLTSGNEVAVANNTSAQTSSSGDYDQKTKEGAKQIQEALNKLGYLDAENITSTFGSITMEAVKKFQSDNGIEATGFVGELTKAKLAEKLK